MSTAQEFYFLKAIQFSEVSSEIISVEHWDSGTFKMEVGPESTGSTHFDPKKSD